MRGEHSVEKIGGMSTATTDVVFDDVPIITNEAEAAWKEAPTATRSDTGCALPMNSEAA